MFNNNDYRRIDDPTIGGMIGEDGNITPEGVDMMWSHMEDMNNNIQATITEIQKVEFQNSFSYPIGEKMFSDLNYHAKTHMSVNIYVCPYQIRESTDKTPFIQYILKKVEDSLQSSDNEGHDVFLDFHKRVYFSGFHTGEVDLMKECIAMLKIIMASYRIFLKNDTGFSYTGFQRIDNTFYVFFDVTNSWINHHYLSIRDNLWLSTIYEMTVIRQVGPYHVSSNVTQLFEDYTELKTLYTSDNKVIRTPIVGYSLEHKNDIDMTMTFGISREKYGNGKHNTDDNGIFLYHFSYDSCYDTLNSSNLDKKNAVIMRHLLFYDKAENYDLYEQDELDDSITEDTLLVTGIEDKSGAFVLRKHGNQTPLTTHDTPV
jgi:hypothetical protein